MARKVLSILMVMAIITTLMVGCSTDETDSSATSEGSSDGKTYEINVGIHTSSGSNENNTLERFKELLEERSDGAFEVKLFPNGALGTELENLEQIKTGEIQMGLFGDNLTGQLASELDPTIIPFLYEDLQDVYDVWDGEIGEKINEAIEERGNQMVVAVQSRGTRKLTASKDVESSADIEGFKVRIPEITSWVTVWKSLGANPTPINLNEVYSALQTGVVDGQENPYALIYTNKFYEVNKNIVLTDHINGIFKWTINKDFYEGLPEDLQKLLMDTAKECTEWGDKQLAEEEAKIVEELEAAGVTFTEIDKEEWRKAAKPGIDEALKELDPAVQALVEEHFDS